MSRDWWGARAGLGGVRGRGLVDNVCAQGSSYRLTNVTTMVVKLRQCGPCCSEIPCVDEDAQCLGREARLGVEARA
jgi:hypothetical protein